MSRAVPGETLRRIERFLCEAPADNGVMLTEKRIASEVRVSKQYAHTLLEKLRASGKVKRFKQYGEGVLSYYQYRIR